VSARAVNGGTVLAGGYALETVLFWILAVGAVVSALLVILPPLARNPLYGALALVVTFCCIAGLYVLLVAHLVAVLQVLVYAGAIMVLFVFVIMLLNLQPHELKPARLTPARLLGAGAAVLVLSRLVAVLWAAGQGAPAADLTHPVAVTAAGEALEYGTVRHVGTALFTDWLVPFELVSLLLLVAIIGAVVLAKKRLGDESAPAATEATGGEPDRGPATAPHNG
jgi:NADH-quinone oxidoreductase subunit J